MDQNDIQKIQEALAHQEMQINDLSEMVITQNAEILKLNKKMDKLTAKLEHAQNQEEAGNGDALSATEFARQNKPPHF